MEHMYSQRCIGILKNNIRLMVLVETVRKTRKMAYNVALEANFKSVTILTKTFISI